MQPRVKSNFLEDNSSGRYRIMNGKRGKIVGTYRYSTQTSVGREKEGKLKADLVSFCTL